MDFVINVDIVVYSLKYFSINSINQILWFFYNLLITVLNANFYYQIKNIFIPTKKCVNMFLGWIPLCVNIGKNSKITVFFFKELRSDYIKKNANIFKI